MTLTEQSLTLFWAKVDKTDACWLWTAAVLMGVDGGYGKFRAEGKDFRAHRLAYELLVGPIPDGLVLDHLCRVRLCVNPAHLEPVTNRENVLRGEGFPAQQVKRTHCPQGHPYDDENTYVRNGMRHCRECGRRRSREYHRKRAEAKRLADRPSEES